MRVLWISHLVPYPPKGGVLQRSYYLLREACRCNDVDLVALTQTAHQSELEDLQNAEEHLEEFCSDVETFQIRWDQIPIGHPLLLLRSLLSRRPYDVNWLDSDDLHRHLRSSASTYDLLHVDTLGLASYTKHYPRTPFVLNHHNIESQMMADRADSEGNTLKSTYMQREARKLGKWEESWAPRAGVNAVVSPVDASRLRERAGRVPTKVVANGVDTEYFRPMTDPSDHDCGLVFVGGMSWYPNRDAVRWIATELWPLIRYELPDIRLTLIGKNPPPEALELAKNGKVDVPGFVDDIRPIVDRALAYVCPIREGGGTRLKVLDALAMAKPLVATEFAVQGLGLKEDVHYLRAETPQEFAKQITRLKSDATLRGRLSQQGRRLVVEQYAWEVIGQDLVDAYNVAVESEQSLDPLQ